MIAFGKTDRGKVRVSNQDAFNLLNLPDGNLLAVVCDGMGGANAGNVASQKACESITAYFERCYRSGLDETQASAMLNSAIVSANIEIYDTAVNNPEMYGMGTTVVAAVISPQYTVISHVGDSRAYLVGGEVTQLTRDHSVVQSLIESGKLTREEAKSHPRKNVITRALGTEEEVTAENGCFPALEDGQSLLLCTDGLTNHVDPDEIKEIFDTNSNERIAEVLIARANYKGGGDNITVVTVAAQQKG